MASGVRGGGRRLLHATTHTAVAKIAHGVKRKHGVVGISGNGNFEGREMTNWFTSDLHFGHQRIIELCNRPFVSVDEMNDALIDNWNSVVDNADKVYILGDLAMGNIRESLIRVKQLKGRKYLIPGNHDRVHPCYPQKAPKAEEMRRLYEDAGLTICSLEAKYWSSDMGRHHAWRLCHFPTSGDHTTDDRYPEYRPSLDDGEWLIHGHVHDLWKVKDRQINVGVDVWNFTPVKESTLQAIVRAPVMYDSGFLS